MGMKKLALAVLLASSALPLRAQVPAAPDGTTVARPAATCPCDASKFKPLTEKAVAAEEYWDARRTFKTATTIGGIGTLFGVIFRDYNALRESTEAYERARSTMYVAKSKAERLGALTVVGDDIDGAITFHLKKGVDY